MKTQIHFAGQFLCVHWMWVLCLTRLNLIHNLYKFDKWDRCAFHPGASNPSPRTSKKARFWISYSKQFVPEKFGTSQSYNCYFSHLVLSCTKVSFASTSNMKLKIYYTKDSTKACTSNWVGTCTWTMQTLCVWSRNLIIQFKPGNEIKLFTRKRKCTKYLDCPRT